MNQSILLPITFWQRFLTVFFIYFMKELETYAITKPAFLEPV